jgi:hypothetical protein
MSADVTFDGDGVIIRGPSPLIGTTENCWLWICQNGRAACLQGLETCRDILGYTDRPAD